MVAVIDQERDEYGVEPICDVLPIAPSTYYEHRARRLDPEKRCDRGAPARQATAIVVNDADHAIWHPGIEAQAGDQLLGEPARADDSHPNLATLTPMNMGRQTKAGAITGHLNEIGKAKPTPKYRPGVVFARVGKEYK